MGKLTRSLEMLNPAFAKLSRRALFVQAVPMTGLIAAAPELADSRRNKAPASINDFGAKGDGRTDDTAAFLRALASLQIVDLPAGSFRITAPLPLGDGQLVRGVGRAGWDPYSGKGPPASAVRTEIVVDGGVAIDARNTNNAGITGLAIRTKNAQQSRWAAEPGFQSGTTGIDITGSMQFQVNDVSFHGLEVAVLALGGDHTAQMPLIDNWSAQDCKTVFSFLSDDAQSPAARDARISGCIAALHCGRIVDARGCDGLRIENVRFFQCAFNSVRIENTPFVSITGATLFETGQETLILRGCRYATLSGVQAIRAGFYHPKPLVQQTGLLFDNCVDLTFDGLIEQPVGRGITIRDCTNLSIRAAIGTPFWSTGNLSSSDGAVRIERSKSVSINASFSGNSYWIALWADAESQDAIAGSIISEKMAGAVRCIPLQPEPMGNVVRINRELTIDPGQSVNIRQFMIFIPSGNTLVSRSTEITNSKLVVSIDDHLCEHVINNGGRGSLSLDRHTIFKNNENDPKYASFCLGIYNPTNNIVKLVPGSEIRLSLGMEQSPLPNRSEVYFEFSL